jgi:hypothetical protein
MELKENLEAASGLEPLRSAAGLKTKGDRSEKGRNLRGAPRKNGVQVGADRAIRQEAT